MAQVDPPPFERDKIVVLPHAVKRIRDRRIARFRGNDATIRKEVQRLISDALVNGCVYDQVPRPFTMPGKRRPPLPFWQRVVVVGEIAFVIDIVLAPRLHVVTVFVRLRE